MARSLLFTGCYTEPTGSGNGIGLHDRAWAPPSSGSPAYISTLDIDGLAETVSPSLVITHPTLAVLYCVNEATDGAVTAFRSDGLSLTELGSASTGGADPCHLAVIGNGRYLAAANFTSGSVSVHRLGGDGEIGERTDLVQQHGSGPNVPTWQAAAHAHQVVVAPDGSIAVADLGADRIFRYTVDESSGKLVTDELRTIVTPAGDGPRHLVFHPDGPVFVANQLGNTVSAYAPAGDGSYSHAGAWPVAPPDAPWGEGPAEIALSADARTLYVSHRGANLIAVFTVDGAVLTPVQRVSCGGQYPRHMSLDDGVLWVANRDSGNVVGLSLDADTGIPGAIVTEFATPSPVCVLVAPPWWPAQTFGGEFMDAGPPEPSVQ